MEGGNNGPALINAAANNFDRALPAAALIDANGFYIYQSKTLANMREDLMVRLGFAAMLATPPPGMTSLLNSFLQDAQEQLYMRSDWPRTERWFAWQTTAGRRFYDTPIDNTRALDLRTITAAYISDNGGRALRAWRASTALTLGLFVNSLAAPTDLEYEVTVAGTTGASEPTWPTVAGTTVVNGTVTFTARAASKVTWNPIKQGINPLDYGVSNRAMPYGFELTQYLELWPTPDKTYVIWLKGQFGLTSFSVDADTPTIEYRPLFLMALANAKAHYGQADASTYYKQLEVLLGRLTKEAHGIRRYIPNPRPAMDAYMLMDDRPMQMPRATFR